MKVIDAILALHSATALYPKRLRIKGLRFDYLFADAMVALGLPIIRSLFRKSKRAIADHSDGGKVIVSLTSFPARIDTVWITIESLIHQKLQPDKIILWLSNDQFQSVESLPVSLLNLRGRGLEIRLVDGDIRSHKKYAYVFAEFPDDFVVIVDDDIVYPSDMIKKLMKDFAPGSVHCSYGSIIRYDESGEPAPYSDWQSAIEPTEDPAFFFGSGGGTLLVPSSLCKDCCDISKATSLCPTADDVWLNAMARLSGLKIKKVRGRLIFPNAKTPKERLWEENVGQSMNDLQIRNVRNAYPAVFARSSTEIASEGAADAAHSLGPE